jgi:hypothetical protein
MTAKADVVQIGDTVCKRHRAVPYIEMRQSLWDNVTFESFFEIVIRAARWPSKLPSIFTMLPGDEPSTTTTTTRSCICVD